MGCESGDGKWKCYFQEVVALSLLMQRRRLYSHAVCQGLLYPVSFARGGHCSLYLEVWLWSAGMCFEIDVYLGRCLHS
jgi:hypothetical protein